MFENEIKLSGNVCIKVIDEFGSVKQEVSIPNMVVTAGKEWAASRLTGDVGKMSHMAVGTGSAIAELGNTALTTETVRVALTGGTNGVATGNAIQFSAAFPATGSSSTLREAGIFNAASVGTMLARTVYDAINKGPADAITITWTVTLA